MSDHVRVVFRKYDGSLHWHATLRRLGEDEHGVWLGAPAETRWQRGSEPPGPMPAPHVSLFPRDAWWVASFNAAPAKYEIYCDVTDVPTWPRPDEVTMVDLDLDVVRWRATGRVQVIDEEEFAEHQVAYGYPADVIARARAAADHLAASLVTTEPFAGAYRSWLTMVG